MKLCSEMEVVFLINELAHYFSYEFVRNAMMVGIMIALGAALLGVPLVLKRYSFIGDGLSHVAFGALAIASVLNLTNNMLIIMPVTVITAVVLLSLGQNAKIKGDAAIALISVSALAIGYILLNVFSVSSNVGGDVCSTLFGATSLLTLSKTDVAICFVSIAIVIAVYVFTYNKMLAVTFDEDFAKATGVNANGYNFLLATVTAVIIVIAMKLVGTLLISALIIFPALSAMRVFRSYKSVVIASLVIALICAVTGIIASILLSTPTGATIVVANLAVFIIFSLIDLIK